MSASRTAPWVGALLLSFVLWSAAGDAVYAQPAPDAPETPAPVEDVEQTKLGTEAPKPLDPRAPNVDWGVGAAVQLDVIYDVNAVGLQENSGFFREYITAQIPIAGPAADRTGRVGFSPNQSRFYGWVGVPTRWGPFLMYARFNLMQNPTETRFQVHRIFGQWAWLHVAYDYTQFLNLTTIPNTLDYEGPSPIPETRRGQGHLRIPLAKLGRPTDFYLAVGAEEAAVQAELPDDVVSRDRVPAVIARLIYAPPGRADLQLSGLYRRIQFSGGGFDTKTNGWAVSFQGSVDLLERDEAIVGVFYGEGLGSYIQDTDGFGLDAAPDGDRMRVIPAFGVWLAYTHAWIKALSSTATFGHVRLANGFDETPNPVGTYHQTYFASVNLIWTPWHALDTGIEYLYGWRQVTENTAVLGQRSNRNHRLMFSVILRFEVSRKGVEKMVDTRKHRP